MHLIYVTIVCVNAKHNNVEPHSINNQRNYCQKTGNCCGHGFYPAGMLCTPTANWNVVRNYFFFGSASAEWTVPKCCHLWLVTGQCHKCYGHTMQQVWWLSRVHRKWWRVMYVRQQAGDRWCDGVRRLCLHRQSKLQLKQRLWNNSVSKNCVILLDYLLCVLINFYLCNWWGGCVYAYCLLA